MSDNLDRNLAILGAVLSAGSVSWLVLRADSIVYAVLIAYIFFACTAYLLIRTRLTAKGATITSTPEMTGRECLLANMVFFVIFAYAVSSVTLRPQPYTRPLGYFVSMGVLAGLLAVESILLPMKRGYEYVILVKIVLVGVLLRWVPQVMFPGHVWLDPWYHDYFVGELLKISHIPEMGVQTYSKLPVMHLLIGSTMLVTGMDFKTTFMMLISPLQVIVQAIFIYLLAASFIAGKRLALLAALMVTIADVVVAKGFVAYPNTLAVILMTVIVYTIFRSRQRAPIRLLILCFVVMATLILTHTVASLAVAALLLCFWLGFEIYKRIHRARVGVPLVTFFLLALFVVAMLSWWMYASGHILSVAKAIQWALRSEHFYSPAPEQAIAYSSEVPVSEVLLDRMGFSMYYAFAAVGCLYLTSKKSVGSEHGFVLALGGVLLTSIGFLGPLLFLYVLPTRWYFISQVALAIPLALGMVLVIDVIGRYKALLLGALVGLMAFSMIGDASANFDTPIFSSARLVRRAFTRSELQSMNTVTDLWDGTVASDQHVNSYLLFGRDVEIAQINEALSMKDFLVFEDTMVLIREYITSNPFHAKAVWKLDYDPRQVLIDQGFEQLYDSGSVMLFYQKPKSENSY